MLKKLFGFDPSKNIQETHPWNIYPCSFFCYEIPYLIEIINK